MNLIPAIVRVVMSCVCSIAAAALFWPLAVVAQQVGASDSGGSTQISEQTSASMQGFGVRLGYNSDYSKATLVYETSKLWVHQFENGWGRVVLNVELGLSYWEAKRGGSESMGQLSAIPMLRWWPNDSFYLEVGSGPTVLSRSAFAGRDLSTRFQFGSHLGIGLQVKKTSQIGIRYSHYSNADIKKPNPGLDIFELAYTYRF